MEGGQGQEHRIWVQIILASRGWEETRSRSYTEGRLHRESLGGGERMVGYTE